MNHQNAVSNSLVIKQMIHTSDLERKRFFDTHKDLNFSNFLRRSSSRENTDDFIHHKGITFLEHVGRQLITGNELLYYPELAKKLREIHDYPTLKRSYEVDKKIKGLGFLKYFYDYAHEKLKNFHVEFEQLSKRVDKLMDLYGRERHLPLIDNLDFVKTEKYDGSYSIKSQAVIVNGVKWPVNEKPWNKPKNCSREIDYLDLHRLLNISSELEYLYLENFVEGTPFITVRLAKTWQHKGHTKWYNLDTRQPASEAEALRWKKPL